VTLQISVGLETVEAKNPGQFVMRELPAPKKVKSESILGFVIEVSKLRSKSLFDVGRQLNRHGHNISSTNSSIPCSKEIDGEGGGDGEAGLGVGERIHGGDCMMGGVPRHGIEHR